MKRNFAIEKLFYENVREVESTNVSKDNLNLLERQISLFEKICKELKDMPEILKLFKKYDDLCNESSAEDCKLYYIDGFRFGVLLGFDILTEFDN